MIDSQKKHLESLHYATATAAALLNVTASAAAAFVASEKRLNQRNRNREQVQQQQQEQQVQQRQQQAMAPQIYSDTYQHIGPKQHQQQAYCAPSEQYKPARTSSYSQQHQVQNRTQHPQSNQYYVAASESNVGQPMEIGQRHSRLAAQQHRPPPTAMLGIEQAGLIRGVAGQQTQLPRSMSFRIHEQLQQQQRQWMHQQSVYQTQYCQARNMQPLPTAQKLAGQHLDAGQVHPNTSAQQLAANHAPLTVQQLDMLSRQRQMQQLTQVQGARQLKRVQSANVSSNKHQQMILPVAPAALAILGASKNKLNAHTGLDMNLMVQLAGANHQHQLNQKQLIQMAHGLDPRQIMAAQSMFNLSKPGRNDLVKLHGLPTVGLSNNKNVGNKPQAQLTTYGLIVSNQDKHKQPQLQQIYAIGAPAQLTAPPPLPAKHRHHPQAVVNGASSDASQHSNLPLILDKRLRSVSFVEKICQIDLTLLWWSLLTICVIFVATIVTISRYVF